MKYMEGLEWVVNHSQSNSIDVNWHPCILDGNRLPLELLGRWDANFCGIWNVFSFVSFPVGSGSIIYSSKTRAAVLQTHAGNCRNQFKDFDSASRWLRWISLYIYIYMVVLTQLGLIQTATGSDCPLLQSCGGSKTDRLRCHDLARDIWWWKWGKGRTVCNNLGCLEIQTFPSGACAFGETTGLCVMRQALLWPCWILICKKGCSHTWPICITTAAFSI